MIRKFRLFIVAIIAATASSAANVRADETRAAKSNGAAILSDEDDAGTLNPQELTMQYWAARSKEAHFDPGICPYGFEFAKIGWHEDARRVFQRCSEHGITSAMPWMAWTEENGYDRPSDPAKAAEWDKKLADAGSSLGQFNYGLDLLRGHGVTQNRALGKSYIDQAAMGGDTTARELARHDYDPESVTPDADKAHYRQPQY